MATFRQVGGVIPAHDLERAKAWYADKLGLKPSREMGDVGAYYEVGASRFLLYPTPFAGTNRATALGLEVDDLEATVAELRENGVVFEDYDMPGLTTENGIASMEVGEQTLKAAWFTDSEGNIIAIGDASLD